MHKHKRKTVIFSPDQLRLLLAYRQLKWSAFISKKCIMIERISFHGKVGRHLGRPAIICVAQQQFVAISYIQLPEWLQMRVLDFVIDPRFPARGTSIKYMMRQVAHYNGRLDQFGLNQKIIRGQHENQTQEAVYG